MTRSRLSRLKLAISSDTGELLEQDGPQRPHGELRKIRLSHGTRLDHPCHSERVRYACVLDFSCSSSPVLPGMPVQHEDLACCRRRHWREFGKDQRSEKVTRSTILRGRHPSLRAASFRLCTSVQEPQSRLQRGSRRRCCPSLRSVLAVRPRT